MLTLLIAFSRKPKHPVGWLKGTGFQVSLIINRSIIEGKSREEEESNCVKTKNAIDFSIARVAAIIFTTKGLHSWGW
ncbi:hypothetical protein FKM82_003856 [Ascaphus truei]